MSENGKIRREDFEPGVFDAFPPGGGRQTAKRSVEGEDEHGLRRSHEAVRPVGDPDGRLACLPPHPALRATFPRRGGRPFRIAPTSAVILSATLLAGCGGPAQIGADPEAFKAVDALYTAVSVREPDRVDRCMATLKSLVDGGKLDPSAYDAMEGMTSEAKGGSWESAQTRLARFMRGQRRGR